MKTLKKASQGNFVLIEEMYAQPEIEAMLINEEIWFMNHHFEFCYDIKKRQPDMAFRISAGNIKEIKVILDKYGNYRNVAISKDDKQYYVVL